MSGETVILIVGGYLGLLVLVMCLLMMAKHGDQASAALRADDLDEPRHRDAA